MVISDTDWQRNAFSYKNEILEGKELSDVKLAFFIRFQFSYLSHMLFYRCIVFF